MADGKRRMVYSTAVIDQLIREANDGYEIDYSAFYNRDTTLRAANLVFEMTQQEMDEYMRCYEDPLYYTSNYCKFKTDNDAQLVTLRPYQEKVIKIVTAEEYNDEIDDIVPKYKNLIWLASRQVGKTTTICAFLSWMLIFHAGRNILIAANKEDTSKEIVDKLTEVFKNLPFFLKPGCLEFGKTGLRLDNNSRVMSTATTNTASIGFTIHTILLDEFAHIPENIVNNFWRSVYPTLSSSKVSQCIITSTPNGTTNKFYDIWSKSVEGKNSFVNVRTDYWEVPGHDNEWAEQQRADFGDEEFAQEYELQFSVNSKMLATAEDMQFAARNSAEYVNKTVPGGNIYLNDPDLKWHPRFDPNNVDRKYKYVMLVDIAEGNGAEEAAKKASKDKTPDSNSIQIFAVVANSEANMRRFASDSCKIGDAFRFIQVGVWESNEKDETYSAYVASALAYDLFNDHLLDNVRVMVEMNFQGKSFLGTFMQHRQYSDGTILSTYHTKPIPGQFQKKKKGFKTTSNKEYYCLKGKKLLGKKRIIVTCDKTKTQMQSYGYVKGKLKGIACHDDLSMPVFNHISRMLDESTFLEWLSDYLYMYPDQVLKYRLNRLLEIWAVDNPEMSDAEFDAMYMGGNEPSIPQAVPMGSGNPYSSGYGQANPYSSSGFPNPYSSGYFGGSPFPIR